ATSERKKVVQNEILVSSKALSKLESQKNIQQNYRSVKTLDQLHAALEQMNYKISHSAIYLRFLPKWFNTEEEKWHVKTVPVKLLRSQNTARKRHEIHISARIPLGLAVANKQAPILMRVEYRVELPDHDWVIAKKYKLIPSVYVILEMQSGKYGNAKAIIYSGPTFIRIHSGKHNTSTAYTHSKDFDDLISDERLHNFTIMEDDKQLKTANDKLEKRNFKAAGEILASVWKNTVIDDHPVLVEYVDSKEHYQSRLDEKSVAWIERHTMTFSNDKGEAMWIVEDTIPKDALESLFQEVKHIRTNQDRQAYLIDWKT
ncbi:22338_t:CDS:2, partial [Gigaspora margarita]